MVRNKFTRILRLAKIVQRHSIEKIQFNQPLRNCLHENIQTKFIGTDWSVTASKSKFLPVNFFAKCVKFQRTSYSRTEWFPPTSTLSVDYIRERPKLGAEIRTEQTKRKRYFTYPTEIAKWILMSIGVKPVKLDIEKELETNQSTENLLLLAERIEVAKTKKNSESHRAHQRV